MYKTLLFFYCCCFAFFTPAQNLLLNGDFEEYWKCSTNTNSILNNAKFTFNPYSVTSPDYFNLCWEYFENNSSYKPLNGSGMIGITLGILDNGLQTDFREFAQIKLKRRLLNNEKVFIKFYIHKNLPFNLSIDYWDIISVNEFGIKFLNDSLNYSSPPWSLIQPDWINTKSISETNGWYPINFQYIARGGEEWIMIGNFYKDLLFPYEVKDTTLFFNIQNRNDVYFYICIDGFSITTSPLPNIFTPNNDGVNDMWLLICPEGVQQQVESVLIFNRWGELVFEAGQEFTGWDGNCKGNQCSEGVYFATVVIKNTQNNSIEKYSGNITLLR